MGILGGSYQHKSRICLSKTSFATRVGILFVFRQIEIELSSAPNATIVDTVDLSFFWPRGKQTSGLNAYHEQVDRSVSENSFA